MTAKEALEALEQMRYVGNDPYYEDEYEKNELIVKLALLKLKSLEKFKATFDAYELATRQGYVAYEILQEQKEIIYKLMYKSLELKNKENKTEYEKGIARGYYIALNMLGYGDE